MLATGRFTDRKETQSSNLPTARSFSQLRKTVTGQSAILNVSEIYESIGELTQEIKSILDGHYEDKARDLLETKQWASFVNVQKIRSKNLIALIERRPADRSTEVSGNIQTDLNKLIKMEVHRISHLYDEGLRECLQRASKANSPVKDKGLRMDSSLHDALKALMNYAHVRQSASSIEEGSEEYERMMQLRDELDNFKLMAEINKNTDLKLLDVFRELESMMKDMSTKIVGLREDFDTLKKTNEAIMKSSSKDLASFFEENTKRIKDHFDSRKYETGPQGQTMLPSKEKALMNRITTLEKDKESLGDRLKAKDEKYEKAKAELSVLQQNPDNARKKKHDVGVWVNLYNKPTDELKEPSLPELLVIKELPDCGTQSGNWTSNIVTLIYSDKLLSDMSDDYDKRPRVLMNDFVVEWFLKRFGIYSISKLLLKDFLFGVREEVAKDERLQVFCLLSGIETSTDEFRDINKHTQQDPEGHTYYLRQLKDKYYQSIEAQQLFFRMAWMVKNHASSHYQQGPFLPNSQIEGADLVPIDTMRSVMHSMMVEENFKQDKIKKIETLFVDRFEKDIYIRVSAAKNDVPGLISMKDKEKDTGDSETKKVRFDFMMRFIMDQLVEHRIQELDQFIKMMKLKQAHKNSTDLSVEEFYSSCVTHNNARAVTYSQAWQDHAYAEMHSLTKANEVPFSTLIQRLIPAMTKQNYAKDFYLKIPGVNDRKETIKKPVNKDKKEPKQTKEVKDREVANDPPKISLYFNTRYNSVFQNKNEVSFGPLGLMHTSSHFYDSASSIIVLTESYLIFKSKFDSMEEAMEHLEVYHDKFKESISRLPQMKSYEELKKYDQSELAEYLESCWKEFKILLEKVYRS